MIIFLVGFMGSGKSHWGKLWAGINEMGFYDLDKMIERSEKLTVADIFEKKGEAYFRKLESVELRNMNAYDHCIIACGGGTACFDNNMEWMNANGLTIYLHASPSELWENIRKETQARPLLKNANEAELLFFIQKSLAERKAFYEQAKLQLRVSDLTKDIFKQVITPHN